MLTDETKVRVVHLIRPLSLAEINGGSENALKVTRTEDGFNVALINSHDGITCSGKYCYDNFESSSVEQIYEETCVDQVEKMEHGTNVTLLAVGPNLTGKTSLMTGGDRGIGIGIRAMRQVTEIAAGLKSRGKTVHVSISAAEFVPVDVLRNEDADDAATDSPAKTKIRDLLNPHGRPIKIVERADEVALDGLDEIMAEQELETLFIQATRARRLGVTGDSPHHPSSDAIYRIRLSHSDAGRKLRVVGRLDVVDLAGIRADPNGNRAAANALGAVVATLGNQAQKGRRAPYKDSFLTHALSDAFGGNSRTVVFVALAPSNKAVEEIKASMRLANFAKNVVNQPIVNVDQTEKTIDDLRNEILRRRDELSDDHSPQLKTREIRDMERLVEELRLAKRTSLDERRRRSAEAARERIKNLAALGMLDYVLRGRKGQLSEQLEARVTSARATRDLLASQFREQRKKVEAVKEELDKKTEEYGAAVAGEEVDDDAIKHLVEEIHSLKATKERAAEELRRLKEERRKAQEDERGCREEARFHSNEMLEKVPEILLRSEKEERKRLARENKEELAKKREDLREQTEKKKAEMREEKLSEETVRLRTELLDIQSEAVLAKLEASCLREEKDLIETHLCGGLKRHSNQLLELSTRHAQIFREYRQACENQKMAVDRRYREIVEEAIQDAIFLSARNSELKRENNELIRKLKS